MFWQAGDTDLQKHSRRNLFLPKDAWLGQRLLFPESCWYFLPHSELSLAPHPSEDQVLSSLLTIAGALLVTKIKWASGFEKNYHFHHPTESDWQAILIAWRTCLKFFFTDWTGILKSFHSLFQCFNKNIVSQTSLFLRKIAPFLSFLQLFTELYESKNSSALSGKEFKEYVLPHHTCSFLMWERMKQ